MCPGPICYLPPKTRDSIAQPNLQIFFDGLEEAVPGMPCYDPAQPWFVHVTVVNANSDPKWAPNLRALDPKNPTAAAGGFAIVFEVFVGVTAALGSQHSGSVYMDSLGAYPGSNACALGFSMQLPKNISKADFGVKYGFRFTVDMYSDVAESNEGDNVFLWDKAQVPPLVPAWKEGDPSPFSNLKFVDFKAIPGSTRELDVLVKKPGRPNIAATGTAPGHHGATHSREPHGQRAGIGQRQLYGPTARRVDLGAVQGQHPLRTAARKTDGARDQAPAVRSG